MVTADGSQTRKSEADVDARILAARLKAEDAKKKYEVCARIPSQTTCFELPFFSLVLSSISSPQPYLVPIGQI